MPLAVLLCAGLISAASAADSPQVIQYPGIYTISTVSCLIDRTDTLDIGQVSGSPLRELFGRDLSRLALYGLRKGTVWRRFSIMNQPRGHGEMIPDWIGAGDEGIRIGIIDQVDPGRGHPRGHGHLLDHVDQLPFGVR